MKYTMNLDTSFGFWDYAKFKVDTLREECGENAVVDLILFIEKHFEGDTVESSDINNFVWFEVECYETCHGLPQCGHEIVFVNVYDDHYDATMEDLYYEIDNGYARRVF